MNGFDPRRLVFRRRATVALAAFVAMVFVTLLAPFVHPFAQEFVCSAQGTKLVVHEPAGSDPTSHADHTAHCPLCLPVVSPPSIVVADFTPVRPLAEGRRVVFVSRVASLVGASLPARGPPAAS